MNIVEKDLQLSTIFGYPKVEGTLLFAEQNDLIYDILDRRDEIFPGSKNDPNYDYIKGDWYGYHDYICVETFPQLKSLFPHIAECLDMVGDTYKDYYFKSWINIWSKGQTIEPHKHYGVWHGNYVIQDTGTETYYASHHEVQKRKIVPLQNFNGHFVMMPSHILHWGQKNEQDKLRVSSAFNICTWDQVILESEDDQDNRGKKVKDIYIPLSDYV